MHSKEPKYDFSVPSAENQANMTLCFFHLLFMNISFNISLTAYKDFIKDIDPEFNSVGFILSLNTVGQGIFLFVLSPWTSVSFSMPFNVLNLACILSFILYLAAGEFKSVTLVALSRFLLGIGAGKLIGRRYILSYAPKPLLKRYSLLLMTGLCLGSGTGPVVEYLVSKLDEVDLGFIRLYRNNWGAAAGLIMYSIFSLIVFFKFKDPYQKSFKRYGLSNKLTRLNAEQTESSLMVSNNQSIEEESSMLTVNILFFTLFLGRVLMESNVVSSLTISERYFEGQDEAKLYKTIIFCIGYWLVGVLTVSFECLFKNVSEREMSAKLYLFLLCSVVVSSYYVLDDKFAYGYGFIVVQAVAPMIEGYIASLTKKKMPEIMQKGFLNIGFLIVLSNQLGKAAGSNLTDLLGKCDREDIFSLSGSQSILNMALCITGFLIIFLCYKRFNS